MEPMIIYVAAHEGDLIKITAAEFDKYIKQAYEAGVADGVRELAAKPVQPIWKTPEITPMPYIGDTPSWWNDYQVYCSSAEMPIVYTVKGE